MTFLRSVMLNFLAVFFINHVMPGIEISSFQNAPNIGADLLFSFTLGFFNASICPGLMFLKIKPTIFKMGLLAFAFSFFAFLLSANVDIGVKALTVGGVVGATFSVFLISLLSNYLEYEHFYSNRQ